MILGKKLCDVNEVERWKHKCEVNIKMSTVYICWLFSTGFYDPNSTGYGHKYFALFSPKCKINTKYASKMVLFFKFQVIATGLIFFEHYDAPFLLWMKR